jgi:L-arabinose isomerase
VQVLSPGCTHFHQQKCGSWVLQEYKKPLCHLHTQFNEEIPYDTIDMDFMNENQSAHGDREYGHIVSRMGIERKIIVGHWANVSCSGETGRLDENCHWCYGIFSYSCLPFWDNMNNVAVTEGDKVEAQIKFGWEIDHYNVNDVVKIM